MPDFERTFGRPGRASAMGARIESIADLPPQRETVGFAREAVRLNCEGVQEPRLAPPKRAPRVAVPADLKAALAGNAKARATFEALPPSHKREYVEWLAEGKRRNWRHERPAR